MSLDHSNNNNNSSHHSSNHNYNHSSSSSSISIYEGWCYKKSWINNWNKRYFILKGTILYSGKSSNFLECKVLYDLSIKGITILLTNLLNNHNIISIWNGKEKILSCYAEKENETNIWYELFLQTINKFIQSILYEGILLKKGQFVQNWKQRFGILTNDKLEYYSYNEKTESYIKRGEILIDCNTSVHILPNSKNHSNRFSITTRIPYQRTLFISVKNIERREEWVTALSDAVSSHLSSQGRLSAFALLSEPGQPGWMNAMFEAEHPTIYTNSPLKSDILKSDDSNDIFISDYISE